MDDDVLVSDLPLAGAPAWSPDGSKLAFHAKADDVVYEVFLSLRSSVWSLFIQELKLGIQRQVGPVTTNRVEPALSPDGSTLAYRCYGKGRNGLWIGRLSAISSSVDGTTWAQVKRAIGRAD